MPRRAWYADPHLGHHNINIYCKRPFKSAEHAIERLSNGFNQRVHDDDTVVCVGDYINYGDARGIPGLKVKPEEYMKLFKGKWVFIEGNHDANNKLKTVGRYMFSKLSHFNVFVTHYPSFSIIEKDGVFLGHRIPQQLRLALPGLVDFVICGHVHEKWKHAYDYDLELWNINVGVDQWNYLPVFDDELINYYLKVRKLPVPPRQGLLWTPEDQMNI